MASVECAFSFNSFHDDGMGQCTPGGRIAVSFLLGGVVSVSYVLSRSTSNHQYILLVIIHYTIHYTILYTIHYTLYIILYYTLYIILYYTIHYTLYIILYYTLYSIHYAILNTILC